MWAMCAKSVAYPKNKPMTTLFRLFCCIVFFLWANATHLGAQTGVEQPQPVTPVEVEDQEIMEAELEEAEIVESYEADEPTKTKQEIFGLNKTKTTLREIPADRWSGATAGLDYSNDVPEPEKKVKEPAKTQNTSSNNWDWNWDWNFWKGAFRVLSIIIFLSLAGWLLYNFVQAPPNSVIRAQDGTEITMDNLEQYIQETDLERFLRLALDGGNYQQAVRVYYLQVIKQLAAAEAITWGREKTNRDYIREMRSHPQAVAFRALTRTYEAVWYGNGDLDKVTFEQVEAGMKRFLSTVPTV